MTRHLHIILPALVLSVVALATPVLAQDASAAFTAQPEPQLAAHHPLSLDLGLGPAVILDGGQVTLKITESVAYHFSGSDEGFHLGLMLGESFADNYFFFDLALRAGYDFKFSLSRNLELGVNPYLGLGLGYADVFTNGVAAFLIQPGVEGKLYLGETIYFFLRPVAFSIYANSHPTSSFDFSGGVGIRL